jgi:dienelactone hydrolase
MNAFKVALAFCAACAFAGQATLASPQENLWDISALSEPPEVLPAPEIRSDDDRIRGLFFAGSPYRGRPTRVFAWLGVPKLAEGAKAPGIVLLHGGGGTAYEYWVKLWVDRGYAAIAIDHFGAIPGEDRKGPHPRLPAGGPDGGSAVFSQLGEPLRDQWPFHAASAAILAHSLLLAQPGVDPERTGVTGISWGGYLTCLVAGLDLRLKFAVPVYGCGHYEDTRFAERLQRLSPEQSALWYAQWDAKNYIPGIRARVLWLNGTNDKFFWPPAWQKSHLLTPQSLSTVSLRVGMKHSHPPAGDPPEVKAFADRVVLGGESLPKVVASQRAGNSVTVIYRSPLPLSKAELIYTSDTQSPWEKREWHSVPAEIADDQILTTVPLVARFYYVMLWNDRGLSVSTNYEQVP